MKKMALLGMVMMMAGFARAETPAEPSGSASPGKLVTLDSTSSDMEWEKLRDDLRALQASDPTNELLGKRLVSGLVTEARDFAAKYPNDSHALNAIMLWVQLGDLMMKKKWSGGPTEAEIMQQFDKLVADEKIPRPRRAEIRGMQIERAILKAGETPGDASAQWAVVEQLFASFQKQFGADFTVDGPLPMLVTLRDEQLSVMAASTDKIPYLEMLDKLGKDPQPQVVQVAKEHLDRLKRMEEVKTKPLEMKFTAVDGKPVDVAKLRGKVVLIDFWATWCAPCVQDTPRVVAVYQKYHDKGFEIIGISLDQDKARMLAFTQKAGMTWPEYFDGKGWGNEISKSYGINSIPQMWLVDKKGMVVSTEASQDLAGQVEKLLAMP